MTRDADRIAELEQRVQSLEATVTGLTEELVEANERIRALEGGERADAPTAIETSHSDADGTADEANTPKTAESGGNDEDTEEESDLDDIIVA